MIDSKTYTSEWIENVSGKNRKVDKILVEKVIRALTLLTDLKEKKLDFIFKGGTALMLMLQKPTRLSIDIDIIISDKSTNIEDTFDLIIQSGNFTKYALQHRNTQKEIEKAHYKFYYNPIIKTHSEEEYILPDILYEDNPYSKLTDTSILSPFIKTAKLSMVKTPTVENILGDKLTAYAPNTTGIPYYKGKKSMGMEIIKQLYDIGNLFDEAKDVETIRSTFQAIAITELTYRTKHNLLPNDILEDIFQTSFCISTRGLKGSCNFNDLQKGITRIRSYIFSERYLIENVIVSASKAAYISELLRSKNINIERFSSVDQCVNLEIRNTKYNKLNKLKKGITEAFFYWYKALELRNED